MNLYVILVRVGYHENKQKGWKCVNYDQLRVKKFYAAACSGRSCYTTNVMPRHARSMALEALAPFFFVPKMTRDDTERPHSLGNVFNT